MFNITLVFCQTGSASWHPLSIEELATQVDDPRRSARQGFLSEVACLQGLPGLNPKSRTEKAVQYRAD